MSPVVFPDTGVLLSMIVFPRNRDGKLTLAGEVLELYNDGKFELRLGRSVVNELDIIIDERFQRHRSRFITIIQPFTGKFVRWPTPTEIAAVAPSSTDPADTPIFASAILSQADIVLSNDFRAFHTDQAKELWQQYNMTVESLYGLLCVFGQIARIENT